MKLAVIGSRTFDDKNLLRKALDTFYPRIELIVSGGASGADTLAEEYAKEEGIPLQVLKPDWKTYGKAAGFIRNKDIVQASDVVVAFWDCVSKGTANSIQHGYTLGKQVIIVPDFI